MLVFFTIALLCCLAYAVYNFVQSRKLKARGAFGAARAGIAIGGTFVLLGFGCLLMICMDVVMG